LEILGHDWVWNFSKNSAKMNPAFTAPKILQNPAKNNRQNPANPARKPTKELHMISRSKKNLLKFISLMWTDCPCT
jgi:hypothetical protein